MKYYLKLVLLITPGILFMSSCSSYKYSNKSRDEAVSLDLKKDQNIISSDMLLAQNFEKSRGFASLLLGPAVSLATSGVKKLISVEKDNYTAEWGSQMSQVYFYDQISDQSFLDPAGMQFDGIRIIRTFKGKKGVTDTAMVLFLSVDKSNPTEIINNSVFRLKIDRFALNYSKTKVPVFKWYMPWTIFNGTRKKVNLDLEIILNATWINEQSQIFSNIEIGRFNLNLRNVPFSRDDPSFYEAMKGKTIGGQSFLVPRSFGYYKTENGDYKPCYGQGLYTVTVNVNEAGKKKYVSKAVSSYTTKVIDALQDKLIYDVIDKKF